MVRPRELIKAVPYLEKFLPINNDRDTCDNSLAGLAAGLLTSGKSGQKFWPDGSK